MKTRFIFYLSLFLLFSCNKKPSVENSPTIKLNFEAAKAYFPLVERIQNGDTISEKEWTDFFNIKGNRLFLKDMKYDKEDLETLKESIKTTYQPEKERLVSQEELQKNRSSYINRYKKNHQSYQDYLGMIEGMQVAFVDSIVMRTKAFLPKELVIYRAMPTIYYHALNNDGNATVNNRIFMSVLASYERNVNRMGNVEAHELHHNFRPDLSYYVARSDSSYYRTEIDEEDKVVYNALMLALNEGLADMVDKDLLLADNSKWWLKDTIQALYMEQGENVVKKLNGYLAAAANGATQNLELYDALYLSYDGHIPGFFMAKAIKDNGRLGKIIENVDNPFIFFLTYQEVALIDKQLPVFDDEVTSFLKKLNTKYLNKPKTKYQNTNKQDSSYPRHVGDITFDEAIDSKEFQLCDDDEEVRQYFNFGKGVQYKGEKLAIIEAFEANYKPVQGEKETGLIRIRFIVNCKGQTGRFRIIGMDTNYQKKDFDSRITNQLLSITKNLSGWKTMPDDLVPYDYYQYLIFKMENGQIKEILP